MSKVGRTLSRSRIASRRASASSRVEGRGCPAASPFLAFSTNFRFRHCLDRSEKHSLHSQFLPAASSRASTRRSAAIILGAPPAIPSSSLLASSWLRLR